jgi:hypothetical protein
MVFDLAGAWEIYHFGTITLNCTPLQNIKLLKMRSLCTGIAKKVKSDDL